METTVKNVNEMSTAELEKMLAERKKEENAKRLKEREDYEKDRDFNVLELYNDAVGLSDILRQFKDKVCEVMDMQATKMNEYGMIRGNSKGGFSVLHSSNDIKITRRRDTDPVWDERAVKATELIKEFLTDTVKKRDLKLFQILITFLEKNKDGDMEYAKVFSLLQHEDKFDDDRWLEGLKLLKESYSLGLKGYSYQFFGKDNEGRWESLDLNFSAL